MRKILIVDDEKIERNGLKKLLKKIDCPVEVYEAANGKEAFQMLTGGDLEIDILLTDIKMPFMSGLDLVKEVRKLKPGMQIAIFSGYGEFEFAKEAIKYGVTDYVLKPVNPDEFKQTMVRILEACEDMDMKKMQEKDSAKHFVKHWMMQYLFTSKDVYMEKILDAEYQCGFQKCIRNLQNMMLLVNDANFFEDKSEEIVAGLKKQFHREIGYINLNSQQILLFFEKNANNNYKRIAASICQWLQDTYGQKCYIAVSRLIMNSRQYPKIYQELEIQMGHKFYRADETVFPYENYAVSNAGNGDSVEYLVNMRESIRLKDIMHIWDSFEKIQEQTEEDLLFSHIYTKFVFSEIVRELYAQMNGDNSADMITKIEGIYQAKHINQILEIVRASIQEFEKNCVQAEQGGRTSIAQIKQYILYHVDEDLSVEKLASKVYLSQGHLSYIFKKETGMNLSRYIKECRMETAKKLLRETNMKIVQICEKVGFSNVSYFCQSFREYCGVSPEKYRKGEIEDET